jgi:radical SAM protein with 4Fe4S-binding SPASM domain
MAQDVSGTAPGGKRTKLVEVLPLTTPYVLQIFPIALCNFKCNFCVFSVPKKQRGFVSDYDIMSFELYKKCLDDMVGFKDKIKVLRLAGVGEPLLHKNIIGMLEYATQSNVAYKTELITNGSLLEPRLISKIVASGLSRLIISIEGTSRKRYREISKVEINFPKFLKNLRHLYKIKNSLHIHIKIASTALVNDNDKQRFFDMFGGMCDTIGIEQIVPIFPFVDFRELTPTQTQYGLQIQEVKVCPQPFYTMQINPDGKVVPCYSVVFPEIMGDCNKESAVDIWNGAKFNKLRCDLLSHFKEARKACGDCNVTRYRLFPEDNLDNDIEYLRGKYAC